MTDSHTTVSTYTTARTHTLTFDHFQALSLMRTQTTDTLHTQYTDNGHTVHGQHTLTVHGQRTHLQDPSLQAHPLSDLQRPLADCEGEQGGHLHDRDALQ